MMMIHSKYLKKVKTMSALKVLVAFFVKADKEGDSFEYSLSDISKDSGVSKNTIRKAVQELMDLGFIVFNSQAGQTNKYRVTVSNSAIPKVDTLKGKTVSKVDTPKNKTVAKADTVKSGQELEWSRAVASSEDEQKVIINDLKDINILKEDINSLTILNNNLFLNDKELGQLAKKIFTEKFLPVCGDGKKQAYWFAQQMKIMKDLLVEYRTEQVIAGIEYWGKINRPKNGLSSLVYLKFKKKNGTNMMEALDYFKSEYLKVADELEKNSREAILADRIREVEEKKKVAKEEKKVVDNMTDDDFLSNLLGGFGKIEIKKE
jgi:biotin operon repressor